MNDSRPMAENKGREGFMSVCTLDLEFQDPVIRVILYHI